MYGELASVKGIVDLTPQEALNRAEAFLLGQGYAIVRRTDVSLTAQRRAPEHIREGYLNLTVAASPEPNGGVQIKVRGNDQAGVTERQSAWLAWSESLPKRADPRTGTPDEQSTASATELPLPPPPKAETADLPPPPQTPPRQVPLPPVTTQSQGRSLGRWAALGMGGCLVLVVLGVALVGGLALLGSGGVGSGSSGDVSGGGSERTFTKGNYGVLVANPEEQRGARVDITGQLLANPEKQGSEVAFQMWADPVKVDWSTIVRTDEEALDLRMNDYVRVRGTVLGSFEGENAFGGAVSAVEVEADEVERVEPMTALDPTQETVEVGKTLSREGFSLTLEKIEFAGRYTRVYIRASYDGDKNARLDLYRSKIFQNSKPTRQKDPFEYNLPKPQAGLRPGDETEGVVNFGRTDPSQPLQVSFAWDTGGYMDGQSEPLVFDVAP